MTKSFCSRVKVRAEKIRIRYSVSYYTYDCAVDVKLRLGTAFADAVYTRSGGADFNFDPSLSSASREEIDAIYWGFDPNLSKDRFLHYDFANLKPIAAGPASLRKRWLKGFLGECPDTTEKRQLAEALARN